MIIPQINIICVVDVVGALKTGKLEGNHYIMDNSRSNLTTGQGTEVLSSSVRYTQVLNWHVWPIDVQTDVQYESITFYRNGEKITTDDTPCAKLKKYGAPSGDYWAGVVNTSEAIEGGLYHYKIALNMNNKIMETSNFPSIFVS